ncbi:MAG: transposase [Verrucomicrobia bacterium]|nr:transposase [Verrucomicrobiota bacterium]
MKELDPEGKREFLLRVRSNLKGRVLEVNRDGSALIEVESEGRKMPSREIQARVRVGQGKWSTVRLWTSLVDCKKHPAAVLVELYSRRWEQEGFYRELKVDTRSSDLIRSHTPETAAQEIAGLLISYALLVEQRLKVADMGEVEVARISFLKVMETVSGLWRFLEAADGMMTGKQVDQLVKKVLQQVADSALGKRRKRSCPRGLRQPVSSWPRITKNTYKIGGPEYQTLPIKAELP